ncbi:CCA tRNA nucleotidyltransferase [Lactococcus termiticola]|uniref:CCA-adding enzyme n=1 Tax=Lactococcus termiticola TaxID=2169526 RepID=A0A2R5HKJ2_9LACT|nr:CCA tRNA nucleotidyltransferase [Lactococcus termiticola]GBG97390.1 tRNA CCA-pyrophosphorylase [Lactococcus termiticola]
MKIDQLPLEFERAKPVLEKIIAAGFEAYFVGGSVRDVLLGRPIHDVDIATSAYPQEIKKIFPYTIDIGIEHGTVLVLAGRSEEEHYEVTTFRTESTYTDYRRPDHVDFVRDLSEDLKRRDFTINAFACDIHGNIIDQFDGLADLEAKKIRAVGAASERFNEDALRIMRAMRFSATLDFEIEDSTFEAMKACAPLLEKISVERIFIELDKLLTAEHWARGLEALIRSQAYQHLIELELSGLEAMLSAYGNFQFQNAEQAWSAIYVKQESPGLKAILRKWKCSNAFIKKVTDIVSAYQLEAWTLESIYQYGLDTAGLVDELKQAEGLAIEKGRAKNLDASLQIHDKSELALSGKELMAACNITPGPELGQLLKAIEHQIVNNKISNEREAILAFAKEELK